MPNDAVNILTIVLGKLVCAPSRAIILERKKRVTTLCGKRNSDTPDRGSPLENAVFTSSIN